jgi:hypothetical protein
MMLSVEPSIISSGGEGGGGEEDIAAAMVNNTLTDDSDILGSDHPIPINDSIDDDDIDGGDDGEGGDDSTSIVESLPSSDILASISPIFNNDDDIDDLYEQKYYTTHGDEDGDEDDGGSNLSYYSNDDHDQEEEEEASLYDDDDDLSLGFPPGYVVTLDDLDPLQNIGKVSLHHQDNKTTKMQEKNNNNNTKGCDPRTIPSTTSSVNVNPSIVPSFFFCPLTRSIMRDPVITPDGYTYERRAILRYLCLGLGLDPMSNNPLQHVDLVEDRLVRQAIDKARKEAWIRYVVELPNIDDENDNNDKVDDDDDDDDVVQQQSGGIMYDNHKDVEDELNDSKIDQIIDIEMRGRDDDDDNNDKSDNKEDVPSLIASKKKSKSRRDHRHHHHQEDADENNTSVSTPTLSNNTEQLMLSPSSQSNHGWSVPLGVHRITCMSPGLLVTADVHRRSNIVQRKIIHNSLTKDNDDDDNDKEEMVGSYRKSKQ